MIAAHQASRSGPMRRPQANKRTAVSAAAIAEGKTRREIVVAEDAVTERLKPVGEGRFVEAVIIIEVGNDVIAPLQHLARSLGETRLVAIDQRQGPRAGDMEKEAREKDEREFARHSSRARDYQVANQVTD